MDLLFGAGLHSTSSSGCCKSTGTESVVTRDGCTAIWGRVTRCKVRRWFRVIWLRFKVPAEIQAQSETVL